MLVQVEACKGGYDWMVVWYIQCSPTKQLGQLFGRYNACSLTTRRDCVVGLYGNRTYLEWYQDVCLEG